jgi:hypothetical protein
MKYHNGYPEIYIYKNAKNTKYFTKW